ncbi:MAG: glycine C-acetyltransferase [Gammaproteobacteria bacterium]|nr:glycine C-acetyltransferase [Gammaproteobacteria bacterium]
MDDRRFLDSLSEIDEQGLYKRERIIRSPQGADIDLVSGEEVINFCANNYLGLANSPELINAAIEGLKTHGFGLASVRFICGTQDIHKELEKSISEFLRMEDSILYSSCFDANTGLFETLFDEQDAIISDALNHASVIDGVRLCKAARFRYQHSDLDDLESKLKEAQKYRSRIVATDGVFSMDGEIADLKSIAELTKKYDAMLMVDDSHATGFVGDTGRGSAEFHNVMDQVDILTSTLGKALGGASGGFTSSSQSVIDLLRQRSRPYLFSNTVSPPLVYASIKVFSMLDQLSDLRSRLWENTAYFREQMQNQGFDIKPGIHPIVPVMLYDAKLAQEMAARLLAKGIYVIGFFYPVVPKNEARIRVQLSAAHSREQLDKAIVAFAEIGRDLGVIS